MRMTFLGLAFMVLLAGGCQLSGQQPLSKQEALSRCGGVSTPGAIVAGTDNQFFTASSRQTLKIKPGVDIKTGAGPDGKVHTLTLISRDNSINLDCRCPSGCSESGDGCVPIVVIGSRDAICAGDCETAGGCCFGCGWH